MSKVALDLSSVTVVGLDLAKLVFQVRCVDAAVDCTLPSELLAATGGATDWEIGRLYQSRRLDGTDLYHGG